MYEFAIGLIGVLIGAMGAYAVCRGRCPKCAVRGIEAFRARQQAEKQEHKEQILAMLKEKGTIANDDIEERLGVSHNTATNYLQELVEERAIDQVGARGRSVVYKARA